MLKSIGLRYSEVEDRLILHVEAEQGAATVRRALHLTRRCCALWLPQLASVAQENAAVQKVLAPETRAAVAAMHHEAMANEARIRSTLAEQHPQLPAAELVLATSCKPEADNHWCLRFDLQSGQHLTLRLSESSVHGLISVVHTHLGRLDWGLTLPVVPGTCLSSTTTAMH